MCDSQSLYKLFVSYVTNNCYCPELTGVQLDSRNVTLGNLFAAVKGFNTDGGLYVDHVIRKGASVVLLEGQSRIIEVISKKYSCGFNKIPVIHISHLSQRLSDIAGIFYNHPSRFLNLIGITGTNGKTTVAHLLANWVQLLGEKSAIMGTLGNGVLSDVIYPSPNTTCSSVDIQKILAKFIQDRVTFVAMEVSSHGLAQYRVDALHFKVAIFTNLSHDHLDYHGSVVKYAMSKWRLFNELCVERHVINADDCVGFRWLSYLPQAVAVTVIGNLPRSWKGKWICVLRVNYNFYGTSIFFNSSWGKGMICTQLLGDFNVSNLLLALGTLLVLGYPLSLLVHTASQLRPVNGRMEIYRAYGRPTVIVDYAHTPDALRKTLITIKRYCFGRLWCVFGCGGDRDRDKRVLMGSIAHQYANYIIITNDNPRTEEPKSIVNDIVQGIVCMKNLKIIEDRYKAIKTAISWACSEDIILISGKGHERYQIIGHDYIDHSDQDIVKEIFKNDIS